MGHPALQHIRHCLSITSNLNRISTSFLNLNLEILQQERACFKGCLIGYFNEWQYQNTQVEYVLKMIGLLKVALRNARKVPDIDTTTRLL
jgi:hypothetical protein